jgi:hypothetical protein
VASAQASPAGLGSFLLFGQNLQSFAGAGAQRLTGIRQIGSGAESFSGTGAQILGGLRQSGAGAFGIVGTGAQRLLGLVQSGSGLFVPSGAAPPGAFGSTLIIQSIASGYGLLNDIYLRLSGSAVPEPQSLMLVAGANVVNVPPGSVIQCCYVFAPQGSQNVKVLRGTSSDVGFASTFGGVIGCTSGGTFVVTSTGGEEVFLVWF